MQTLIICSWEQRAGFRRSFFHMRTVGTSVRASLVDVEVYRILTPLLAEPKTSSKARYRSRN